MMCSHDKATAASKPVPMPLPAQVRILMSQHIGAPAKALVKKGDEVFVGTKIGEAGGFVSANIHSSVSGTVAAVCLQQLPCHAAYARQAPHVSACSTWNSNPPFCLNCHPHAHAGALVQGQQLLNTLIVSFWRGKSTTSRLK